ncbi:MAG TPA: DUF4270 family protein, partial [Cytophagales bacterium]|nr:DUF4270 family protein [Cytophagales bacterium]
PLELSTMRVDSNKTRYLNLFLAGNLDHPEAIANQVVTYSKLNYATMTLDALADYDSMFITINKVNYIYGDTTQAFTLKVFPTLNALDTNQKYAFQTAPLASEPIAQTTFVPRNHKNDSSKIKIAVDSNYAKKILETIKNPATNKDVDFSNAMKALAYVGSSDGNNTLVLVSSADVKVVLYYKIKDLNYSLDMSPQVGNTISYSYASFTNQLKNQLSTLNNRDTVRATDNNGRVYLQHFSALDGKFTIPKFDAMVGLNDHKILINRAEIILKSSEALNKSATSVFNPGILTLRYSDKFRKEIKVGNTNYMYRELFSDEMVESSYNFTHEYYSINVTDYIQKLVDKKLDVRDLILETNSVSVITLGDGTQNPKNFILKIYYSKLK